MTLNDEPTLADLGFTPAEAQAVRALWHKTELDALYKPGVTELRQARLSPERVIDAKRHHLLDETVIFFTPWKMPAHWIAYIQNNPNLNHNLRDDEDEQYRWNKRLLDYAFKANAVPYDFFIQALAAADDHGGAWTYVRRWVRATNGDPDPVNDTATSVEAEAAMMSGLKRPLVVECRCAP